MGRKQSQRCQDFILLLVAHQMSSGLGPCYKQKEESFPFEGKQGTGFCKRNFPVWDLPGKALKGRPTAQELGMDSVCMLNDFCGNMSYFCPVL